MSWRTSPPAKRPGIGPSLSVTLALAREGSLKTTRNWSAAMKKSLYHRPGRQDL